MIIGHTRILLTLLIAILLAPLAVAQSLDPVAPTPTQETERKDNILIVANPVEPVVVDLENPVDAEFRVTGQSDPLGTQSDLSGLNDIRLRGVARADIGEGDELVIQLLVTEIERAGALTPLSGFGSTWRAADEDDLVLSIGDEVEIEGDRRVLADALATLAEAEAEITSATGDEDVLEVTTSGQEQAQGASPGVREGGGTLDGAASGYTQPSPVETEADPVIETRETKTGCTPRIDLALRVAIDRIRDETYTDGQLTETGDCYDSYHEGDKYALERDYTACAVKVELGRSTATGRFKWFYRNGDGSRIDVATGSAACIDDATRTYAVTEDHDACKVAIDHAAFRATPQSRLVYEGSDGVAVEVRACRPSTTRQSVPLVLNTNLCNQPESGQQMAVHTYTIEGVLHRTGVCAPSGTTIESRTEYADCGIRIDRTLGVAFRQVRDQTIQDDRKTEESECYDSYAAGDRFRLERDYGACTVDVDLAVRRATGRFKLHYSDADGVRRDVSDCASDPERVFAVFEDHACRTDHSDGKAIRQSRLVYQTRDGMKHEVRECGPSEDPARTPVAMTFNTEVCGNPDGTAVTRQFLERGRYEYELDGVTRTHGNCRNTGRRIEYRADHDACRVEIDEVSKTVFKRFKIETVIDGAVTATSACMKSATDPGNRPMERDYTACTDMVDYSGMRKTYRFRYKYEDPHSRRTVTLTCQDDPGRSFALLEDFGACTTTHDLTAMTATPQSRIIYRKPDGAAVEVRVCGASVTKEAAAITEDFDACPLALEPGRAIPQARLVYTADDGTRVEARGCAASPSRAAIAMSFNTDRCENRQPSADIPFDSSGVYKYDEQGIYEYEFDGETRSWGECRATGREIEFIRQVSCEGRYGDGEWDFGRMRLTQRFGIRVHAKEKGTGRVSEIIETFHGPCFTSDGWNSWPIIIDYDADFCPDRTDFGEMRHTPRGLVRGLRPASEGGELVGDPHCRDGMTYVLTEDHEACNFAIDKTNEKAVPQSRIVYTDEDGAIHVARHCQKSESRAEIALVRNTDICTVRPGNTDGIFQEQAAWTYKIGETVHRASECEETGVTWEYRTNYGDCAASFDHDRKLVIQRVQKQTYKNGVMMSESACADSAELADRAAYSKAYNLCGTPRGTPIVNEDQSRATSYFKWIYLDRNSQQQEIDGVPGEDADNCHADPDRQYVVYEDHDACTFDVDYNTRKVTPQARLVYRTQDGQIHQVRDCEASGTRAAVDLVERADLCSIEHDLAAGKSFQQTMNTFTVGRQIYQADECSRKDGAAEYAHEKYYDDCQPLRTAGHITRRYKLRINVDGEHRYIQTVCQPDADTARIAIQSTTEGCDDPQHWIHDIAAGVTYALHRQYYIETGKTERTYLTQCVASGETLTHDVTTVGYQYLDGKKANYPISKVVIELDDGTEHVIHESRVLPGATLIPYTLDRTVTEYKAQSERRSYEGCTAYDKTNQVEIYERSDGTEYRFIKGEGTPVNAGNACSWRLPHKWQLVAGSARGAGHPTACYGYRWGRGGTAQYTTYRQLYREDGRRMRTQYSSFLRDDEGNNIGYRQLWVAVSCGTYAASCHFPAQLTQSLIDKEGFPTCQGSDHWVFKVTPHPTPNNGWAHPLSNWTVKSELIRTWYASLGWMKKTNTNEYIVTPYSGR